MPSPPAFAASSRDPVNLQRALQLVLAVYLVLIWFGGGPTVDVTAADEWLMLLALAPLTLGAAALLTGAAMPRLTRAALLLALLLPLIPLLQLVTVADGVWHWSDARRGVSADLLAAGLSTTPHTWSLWPEATTRALYALLPALACFLGALGLGDTWARRLVPLALGLVLANLAFGFFQVGLPPNSGMRLYTANGTGIGGVLVNGNHQGTALVVGMLLSLGLWARERHRQRDSGQPMGVKAAAYATASLVCLTAVALAGSSAAMIIALVAFAAGVIATGLLSVRRIQSSRGGMAAGIAVLAVLAIGLLSAQGWMNLEQTDAMRYQLARETAALGVRHAPLGSGAGTFMDSYAQSASALFQRGEYINHAHNEFAQWWFEGGWPALALLIASLGVLVVSGWRLLRSRRRDPVAIACWLAIVAVLAHSWVDFPLRTLSLMSLTALLAGIVVGAAAARDPRQQPAPAAPAALQRA